MIKMAAAQITPKQGDIAANLEGHCKLIHLASLEGVDLVIFPEMSITGYCREEALGLAFSEEDPKLKKLRQLSVTHQIIIVAGAPIIQRGELYIGSFILKPDRTISIYTKQFLHAGEDQFFTSSFNFNPIVHLKNERICLSICADIDFPQHAEAAAKNGGTIYASSIFFTTNGIDNAHRMLSGYAQEYKIHVLMSNYTGPCWGLDSGGKSAVWANDGNCIVAMNIEDTGLVIAEKKETSWNGKIVGI